MATAVERLPRIDEHSVEIATGAETTWPALLRVVEGSFGSSSTARVARLLGCADLESAGARPLAAGSALPGFHVETAEPHRELALVGSHRYSDYALIFHLDEARPDRTRIRAETRAAFPGLKGEAYRTLVIRTRGHVLVTRRILDAVRRRAERSQS